MKTLFTIILFVISSHFLMAQEVPLVANIAAHQQISLNGKWNYIIDPLENGFYNYRMEESNRGFFENKKAKTLSSLIEYDFDTSPQMNIPSDWNSQSEQLFFYEGTIWFKKDFSLEKKSGKLYVLYFGAVNYEAIVYVNGKKVGRHIGGYTPFNFDVTNFVKDGNNFVVVKADNKRRTENVPTINMDWWNYGGITRGVTLVELPETYIEDYTIQLSKPEFACQKIDKKKLSTIAGWIKLNKRIAGENLMLEIPELKISKQFTTDAEGCLNFQFSIFNSKLMLWTPENPKLYDVKIAYKDEVIQDKIGFRTIETSGKKILLNGKQVFLRGISIHEEAPYRQGRASTKEDAITLLTWAKELGCNYVRLAHYPHNENMVREAERLGLMVWSEIPVYWTIQWENEDTYANAERQLHDMIYRDKNRCNVVVWSIANETQHGKARDLFLTNLAKYARQQDSTRLISMAMEVTYATNNFNELNDNMNKYVDVISFNEYIGWYRETLDDARLMKWSIPYDKPVIISEFGGGALQGLHGDKNQRWTEEYQEELYIRNLEMLEKIDGLSGMSPWILVDFRSPRRQLYRIQDFFNRKGLISDNGIRKKAFYIMQNYYEKKGKEYQYKK